MADLVLYNSAAVTRLVRLIIGGIYPSFNDVLSVYNKAARVLRLQRFRTEPVADPCP